MKKLSMILVAVILVFAVNAQSIALRTSNSGISKLNDQFTGFEASFSYNEIEAVTITGTQRGTFSALNIEGAIMGGDFGTPQLPVLRKMIQIPVGATPKVVVKNFTTTEYNLEEYGIHKIYPRQPDIRKDWDINDIPFLYDEKAYSMDDFNQSSIAEVKILGTMRGVIIGVVDVHPVQYNPVAQTILVHNDIEVEVVFENANLQKTEELLVGTYSPYFKDVYRTLFNDGVTRDLFDDRPDLYSTPVHMLVISHRMFEATLQPWIEWKTQKGFFVDVNYTDEIGTTAAQIKTFCHNKYNQGSTNGTAPTFIVLVGDVQQVAASQTGSLTGVATDLYYATVDAGYFPSMYYSRMSAQTTQQLANIIEKTLYYEKYQFADPTYLDNVLLIAGADASWAPRLGRPQINYAADNYYNAAHGYANIHKYVTSSYTGCYTHLNNVGFANFTAHCGITLWSDPDLTITMVENLTNINKYFVAMGNCCQAADFGANECMGEAMIRQPQKAAVGYIGSSPNSYWYDDFHFTVGAYSGIADVNPAAPTLTNTMTGCYDFMFRDADFNTLCSHIFGGNISVTYAHITSGYSVHTSNPRYYWEAYNVLGDGSIMPYNGQAAVNNVSHMPILPIGLSTYEVTAVPGSYVAISKDGVLHGVAVADNAGLAVVTLNPPVYSGGDVDIVVTRNQYQPYTHIVPAAALEGPYIVYDSYIVVNQDALTYTSVNCEITTTIKNVGADPTTGPLTVTITTQDPQITINTATATVTEIMDVAGTATVNFNVTIANDIVDNKTFTVFVTVTQDEDNVWESRMTLTAYAPNFSLETVYINGVVNGILEAGTITTINAVVKNKGQADAYLVQSNITFENLYINYACDIINNAGQNIPAGESAEFFFTIITSPELPFGYETNINLLLSAQYGVTYTAPFNVSNSGADEYCATGSTNCSLGDKFTLVQLYKTSTPTVFLINNNDVTCSSNGYQNFTNIIATLEPGEQYTIKVIVNYANSYVGGWFDLNGNKVFESNERLINLVCPTKDVPYTQNFTIPATAQPGSFRFRLRDKWSSALSNTETCEGYSYGQTHDYTVFIPEIYPRVQNVVAELSGSNITITWEDPVAQTPIGYNIYRNGNKLNSEMLTEATFTEQGVVFGIYAYNVKAVYTGNNEAFSQMSNVICFDLICEKPLNLTGIVEENNIFLSWDEPENIEEDILLLGYNVYRNMVKINSDLVGVDDKEYTDIVAVSGTFNYQVSAVYDQCESSLSAVFSGVVLDYEVTFDINIDNIPVSGVNGVIKITGDFGQSSYNFSTNQQESSKVIHLLNGNYTYIVEIKNYNSVEGNFTVNGTPQTIPVTMLETKYEVTFEVKDIDGEPIGNASIGIVQINTILYTDELGIVSIILPIKNYNYIIKKNGYDTVESNFKVEDTDQIIPVELNKTVYQITFEVKGIDDLPLEGAEIAFVQINTVLQTDADGIATISLPNGDYDFTVFKNGYGFFENNFKVSGNPKTIEVKMLELFPITFEVKDNELKPIEGVTITITEIKDDMIYQSDESGRIIIHLTNGDYNYFASKENYKTSEGTFVVDGEPQLVPVNMVLSGIEDRNFSNITLYPNPTTGELRIENGELRIKYIEIFDVIGRVQSFEFKVQSSETRNPESETLINISHLSAGIYFIQINTDKGVTTKKVVKK